MKLWKRIPLRRIGISNRPFYPVFKSPLASTRVVPVLLTDPRPPMPEISIPQYEPYHGLIRTQPPQSNPEITPPLPRTNLKQSQRQSVARYTIASCPLDQISPKSRLRTTKHTNMLSRIQCSVRKGLSLFCCGALSGALFERLLRKVHQRLQLMLTALLR